jgi:plastocyanin
MPKTAIPPLRYLAGALLVVGGLVHLQLYFDGYKSIDKVGPSFLLNAIASVVVAFLVVAWPTIWSKLAGIAVAGATLVAFVLSRNDLGLFGYNESGFEPSPQAVIAFVAEILAIVVLVALLFVDRGAEAPSAVERRAGVGVGIGLVIAAGVFALIWGIDAKDTTVLASDAPTTAGAAGSGGNTVTIADFAFSPKDEQVAAGTTVTWTNNDSFAHSVVADDGSFDSKPLDGGASFSFTFDKAGSYSYICGIHNSMKGTITVG